MTSTTREQHDAIWQPILAAHRVAANLRQQADLFASLSDAVREAWVPGLSKLPRPDEWAAHLRRQADAIERAAPLPITITDEDRRAVWEMQVDCCNDLRSKDMAGYMVEDFTEADWAEAAASMALDTLEDEGMAP